MSQYETGEHSNPYQKGFNTLKLLLKNYSRERNIDRDRDELWDDDWELFIKKKKSLTEAIFDKLKVT